jgi:hypothetical protein
MRVLTAGTNAARWGSGPRNAGAKSPSARATKPRLTLYSTQPTKAGNWRRMPSVVQYGFSPAARGRRITLTAAHKGTPNAAATVEVAAGARSNGQPVAEAYRHPKYDSREAVAQRHSKDDATNQTGKPAEGTSAHIFVHSHLGLGEVHDAFQSCFHFT